MREREAFGKLIDSVEDVSHPLQTCSIDYGRRCDGRDLKGFQHIFAPLNALEGYLADFITPILTPPSFPCRDRRL